MKTPDTDRFDSFEQQLQHDIELFFTECGAHASLPDWFPARKSAFTDFSSFRLFKEYPIDRRVKLANALATEADFGRRNTGGHVLVALMQTQTKFSIQEITALLHASIACGMNKYLYLLSALETNLKATPASAGQLDLLKSAVAGFVAAENRDPGWYNTNIPKLRASAELLLSERLAANGLSQPYLRLDGDPFGETIEADLKGRLAPQADAWNHAFFHVSMANGGKPSKKFLQQANASIDAIGPRNYKTAIQRWLTVAAKMAFTETKHDTFFLTTKNQQLLKGLLWSLVRFHDKKTLQGVAALAEKCFQKIPGKGPAAAGTGNAALYVLARSRGLEGIALLSRLKLRIRQNNTQKLIQSYIEEQATKLGLTPARIEEMAAPDFGLVLGSRYETFGDYQLHLRLVDVGKTELNWIKPDGKPQKSVPAAVKNNSKLSARLTELRAVVKQLKQASTAQRDRIDRLYAEDLCWDWADFDKYYLSHGLVSCIARRLVWQLEQDDSTTPALWVDDAWQDLHGQTIPHDADTQVRLWHPIAARDEPEQVLAWRDRLELLGIQQPLKQAWREIYLLTDAELRTRTYSNRMAAHLLKQHQFNTLSALRGWRYQLLGAYDDGRDSTIAVKPLPAYNMRAEFWIDTFDDDSESWNDAGIWFYIATDQIRFVRDGDDDPIPLIEIPALIFSEIMRDADLFVGVASVGNDPSWQDNQGQPRAREYWQSYSFGDLSETAKTRKTVLERLLPRLKIRDVAHIDGRFLIVDGKRHSYKIHIGSGNILILPNDRYLCIVPSRSQAPALKQIVLPFEGDHGLSIVLSKAFLLAADDRISDESILSQL